MGLIQAGKDRHLPDLAASTTEVYLLSPKSDRAKLYFMKAQDERQVECERLNAGPQRDASSALPALAANPAPKPPQPLLPHTRSPYLNGFLTPQQRSRASMYTLQACLDAHADPS